jgi:preprotein translocase subunit SecF
MRKYILIILAFLFVSCGARKINKTEVVEDKTTVESTIQKDSIKEEVKTEIKYDTETCEVEATPIDSTKEFIVEGKKYFNVRIKIKKKKDNTLYVKEDKAVKTSQKQTNKAIKESKKENIKTVDKKEASSWQFKIAFWLLIILILLRLYIKLRDRLF